jgi:lipopolysaccharide export system protein LptC
MSSRTDMLNEGARVRAEAAARRARMAPILSMAVAAGGAALVLVFVAQAGMFSALKPSRDMPAVTIEKPEQINTQNSRLAGFDKERQPYELTAETGYQDKDTPNLVHMEKVVGAFRKQSGASYQITSDLGLYDTKSKQMDLSGSVQIVEPGRMTATMDRASVGVEDKSLVTDVPVKVVMGSSTIRANGMKITDDGRNILFLNGVKARFNGQSDGKGDSAP